MIPAEEALALAEARKPARVELKPLEDIELVAFGYLDYTIETGIYDKFDGQPFELVVPAEIAKSPAVIEALKRRYEEGRWTVAVFPRLDGDTVKEFHLVFSPKEVVVGPKKPDALPVVVGSVNEGTPTIGQARLLVRMPTRGRPGRAIEVLAKYRELAGMPIQIEVVVDVDDETVDSEFLYRVNALGCTVTHGEHKSKIEACNGGRLKEWDILVLGSDDMVPVKQGWAVRIVELYQEHWPNFDGCLHLDDGYAHDRVCTLSILGRRYYEEDRRVYNPLYKSVFCDDEHTEVARLRKRITYVPEVLIEHQHPAAGKGKFDALYARNDALWKGDEETYKERKAHSFFLTPPMLSVLVLTHPERQAMLTKLLDELYWQKSRCVWPVEILVDHKPADSLGAKRQRLLERATGSYICFVDDDDWVAYDFLTRICSTIAVASANGASPDCASLVGVMTTNGVKMERFEHSLKYTQWATLENGVHVRNPNHLNAIKREIALSVGFENLTYTEDHAFSRAVQPLLKTEADTGDTALYHYWWRPKRTAPAGAVK